MAVVAGEVLLRIVLSPKPEEVAPRVRFERFDVDPSVGRAARYWMVDEEQHGTKAYSFDAPVHVHRLGMRGTAPIEPRPRGGLRIVALGDSMTFGVGVADKDTWPGQLESLLRTRLDVVDPGHVEVLNAGMPGLNVEQEVSLLLERVVPLQPDLVIVGYYWNDMPELADPMLPWAPDDVVFVDSMVPLPAPTSATEKSNNKSRADRQSPWVEGLKDTLRASYLLHYVVQKVPAIQHSFLPSTVTLWRRAVLEDHRSARIDRSWGFVQEQLAQIRDAATTHDFDLLLMPIPIFEQMVSGSTPTTAGYQGRVRSIGEALGVQVIDPLDAVRDTNPSYPADFVPFDGHPKSRIYAAMAEVLAGHIASHPPRSRAR